ncbi:unnamed protein product [Dovyalis caffra]|uniref:non-specific serine/threonine protein kinase n=1 Tax=Dovyalis caffra TaxID=77055 RepID=A0AAV1S6N7_9ROSI|nr:unnamed protein product [Dovyalis caffra]
MTVTEKCDVYSFGVVALETLMGRHPGDILLSSAQAIQLKEVLDPRLSPPTNEIIRQNICIIATLAFSCLHSKPNSRPSMKFVSQEFLNPKRSLVGLEISLLELQNRGTDGEISLVENNMDPCISFGLERQYEITQERPDELDLEPAYENAMHSIYKSSIIIEGKH